MNSQEKSEWIPFFSSFKPLAIYPCDCNRIFHISYFWGNTSILYNFVGERRKLFLNFQYLGVTQAQQTSASYCSSSMVLDMCTVYTDTHTTRLNRRERVLYRGTQQLELAGPLHSWHFWFHGQLKLQQGQGDRPTVFEQMLSRPQAESLHKRLVIRILGPVSTQAFRPRCTQVTRRPSSLHTLPGSAQRREHLPCVVGVFSGG